MNTNEARKIAGLPVNEQFDGDSALQNGFKSLATSMNRVVQGLENMMVVAKKHDAKNMIKETESALKAARELLKRFNEAN